uniref:ATP synthase F0 subunit 8 n=1 Tax=Candidiopotamon okinawense TaxID=320737 RepID=A0A650FF52_9EUCA|nr:ATP synthase F0 subunit 8 [Candidiopotamon okinawense]
MPQMSPLFWLSLFFLFLFSLLVFLMLNYFIKPFKVFNLTPYTHCFKKLFWKL